MSSLVGPFETAQATADLLVKTGNGVLHTVTFACNDAAPTAGSVEIRDATAAGAGAVITTVAFTTTWFAPVSIILDTDFATGLFIDFTTTADVNVTVAYK